ncbi:hypothetical protein AB4Y36_22245 [Paraburkholderia sp. BR10936]|uniref:hypothetical protein n=1 Tax=Paraburkholderia sp. BR10936 TaxID=3236993 RepID=UPI0034D24B12
MTTFIGIDPGAHGAFAINTAGAWQVEDLPRRDDGSFDAAALHAVLAAIPRPLAAALERPLPFVVTNAGSILKLGQSYGALLACLQIVPNMTVRTPSARAWKAGMKLTSEKALSVARAREVLGFRENQRLRHDKAEEVMLAEWCR